MFPNSAAAATVLAALVTALLYAGWTIHRLRVQLATLTYAASHDPLTCLPNRIHAQWLFGLRATDQLPTVVALLDLDEFKHVNDTCGHQAGDQVLVAVADRLATAANRYGGHAARLAGDEFLLLLPVTAGDPVEPVATILAELTAPVPLGPDPGAGVRCVCTVGVGAEGYRCGQLGQDAGDRLDRVAQADG